MQENRESLEQFFAEYGEAGKKVFEEDTDDDEDKETVEEEGNGEEEEKYVKNIMQGTDLTKQGDKLKKKVQTDLKDILASYRQGAKPSCRHFACTERERSWERKRTYGSDVPCPECSEGNKVSTRRVALQ